MATAGTLVYSTRLDTSGMDKGLKGMTGKVQGTGSTIKSILGGLGIAALVSKGINAISSSMDGAIKRLDTMNNFPKVMSNLGIDADKSKASIDKLSKGLQNVPTTLDEAALAVQRFASVNSDVEKSTDIFLAVNDAILAGGASAQIQSSALEQLSQAYSKGKPDMMEWRTIQMAMPAQLKQVAMAMGYAGGNTAQLGEDLRSGKVSMDQFIGTIMDLDKKGTGKFQSFKTQAENSVGGVQTAIANMKTAITRGVASGLDTLDKSLKKANLGGISGVITRIGKVAEQMIKKLATIIPPIIQMLANVYKWMKDHETLVKILAGAILGLMVVVKVVAVFSTLAGTFAKIGKAIKIAVTVFKTLWTIIKLVGTAFKVLGAIMMANPISIVIAIIVALVAAFVLLWKKSEGFRNFWIGLWEGIKNIVIGAWEFLKGLFTGVIEFVKNNWKQILLFLVNPFAGAFALLYKHSTNFRNFINKIVNAVVGFFKSLPEKIKELPAKIWNTLVAVITKVLVWRRHMIDKGKAVAKGLLDAVVNGIKSLPSKMLNVGLNVAKGIGRGITNGVQWIKDRISDMVGNVTKFIKKVFKIGSPSKLMADEVGRWIPAGIAVGIDANTDSALNSIDEMSNEMIRKMQGAVNLETGRMVANANIKGNSFLNTTTVNSHVVADVYMDRTKVGQAITPVVAQTIRKAGA